MTDKELEHNLKARIRRYKELLDEESEQSIKVDEGYETTLDIVNESKWLDIKKYANICGLKSIINKCPEVDNEQLINVIASKPLTFKFLNHLIKSMPEALEVLKQKDARGFIISYISRCNALELNRKVFGRNR